MGRDQDRDSQTAVEAVNDRAHRVGWFLVGAGVIALVLLMFFVLFAARAAQRQISDCVTPGGECYADIAQQTQRTLDAIDAARRRTIVAAFVCNDRPGGQQIDTLTACVARELSRDPGGN